MKAKPKKHEEKKVILINSPRDVIWFHVGNNWVFIFNHGTAQLHIMQKTYISGEWDGARGGEKNVIILKLYFATALLILYHYHHSQKASLSVLSSL